MYGTIDTLWLIEAIVSILMKVLRWWRTISHFFLRICCIVDVIVHFIWMRGIALFSIHFIHVSTSFFIQSQNWVYIFPHISPSRSLCPWPTFYPSWEYYCTGFECLTRREENAAVMCAGQSRAVFLRKCTIRHSSAMSSHSQNVWAHISASRWAHAVRTKQSCVRTNEGFV